MDLISEKLELLRAKLPRKIRLGLIACLVVLSFVFLFVGGGLGNNAILGLVIVFIVVILFLALQPQRAICGALVFAFFCIALYLRAGPSYDGVLLGDWVAFGGNDPWYHMRLVENLVHHFPDRIAFDPYTIYPTGMNVQFAPFFDWLLGCFVWLIGWGHPSVETIETVGAYYPAVLGALVTIPVYFIGKSVFNRTAGLLACGLIAVMPGEFFFRSMLGFTDHHIAEVLFSTTAVMFFILAIKSAKTKEISFSHFHSSDWRLLIRGGEWRKLLQSCEWSSLRAPLIYSALAGAMLGIYLLSWIGGLLFVFIIFVYIVIQYIIDHLRGRPTDYLCIIGVSVFSIAVILVAPNLDLLLYGEPVIWSLVICLLSVPVLSLVSWLMQRYKLNRLWYPLALAALAGVGIGLFYLIAPSMYHEMMSKFDVFRASATSQTIMEARPFFSGFGNLDFGDTRLWRYFSTGFVTVPIALMLVTYAVIKHKSSEKMLLLIWSLVTLVAMLSQTRFSYYFAVNAALLAGYLCYKIPGWFSWVVEWVMRREPPPVEQRKKRKADKRERKKAGLEPEMPKNIIVEYRSVIRYASHGLAAVIIFFLAFFPLIGQVKTLAGSPFGPNEAWHSSLVWMRENTPEPFDNPDFYYELYEKPEPGQSYDYPESAYGVMSWWDYGHWITRIAHRIPNANPHQIGIGGRAADGSIIPGASTFMTAQNESEGSWILDELGSRYVVIDIETDTTKYHTMTIWGGLNPSDFFERYYQTTPEGPRSYLFYYPEYYQSMCSRLYNFEAQSVTPNNSTWAVSYTVETDESGNKIKMLVDAANEGRPFVTYEDAEAFIDDHPDYVIVGLHPFLSPVPLDELEHYKMVHGSSGVVNIGDAVTSYVKIFEYSP
jgi:dolichyl-diphosphooligosaccharide--protein glycosyltransferase